VKIFSLIQIARLLVCSRRIGIAVLVVSSSEVLGRTQSLIEPIDGKLGHALLHENNDKKIAALQGNAANLIR